MIILNDNKKQVENINIKLSYGFEIPKEINISVLEEESARDKKENNVKGRSNKGTKRRLC